MDVLDKVRERSTCDRGRSGAVIVRDKLILSTGYVGSPKGSPHCDDVGHLMKEVKHDDGTTSKHCLRTSHAEANAICQAAKNGIAINGATLYASMFPCRDCAKLIANSGIVKVIVSRDYHGTSSRESREILKNAGVEWVLLTNEGPNYVTGD